MKIRYVSLMSLCALALVACNKTEESRSATKETQAVVSAAVAKAPVEAAVAAQPASDSAIDQNMPELARKYNCSACHSIDKAMIGPAWKSVAEKYKGAAGYTYNGKEYGLEDGLIMKVSKGGSGAWGTMPMPGADASGKHHDDMKKLVQFVLGLSS